MVCALYNNQGSEARHASLQGIEHVGAYYIASPERAAHHRLSAYNSLLGLRELVTGFMVECYT